MIVENMSAFEPIIAFINVVTAFIFTISVLMMIFAGFKYATSMGDLRSMEESKMQIIHAGIGIVISMFGKAVASVIIGGVPEKEVSVVPTEETNEPIFLIVGLIIFGITVVSALLYIMLKEKNDAKVEKKGINLDKKEKITEIKVEKIEEKQEEVVTLETLLSDVSNKTLDDTLSQHYRYIFEQIESLGNHLSELDIESRHIVEESLKKDALSLYESYMRMDDNAKNAFHEEMMTGLLHMRNQIDEIQEKIQHKNRHDLRVSLAVIEKKYAK